MGSKRSSAPTGNSPIPMPAASSTMGGEIASRLSIDGSTAASRMARPATRYRALDTDGHLLVGDAGAECVAGARESEPRWWAQQGSNLRPPRCKRGALPLSYTPRDRPSVTRARLREPARRAHRLPGAANRDRKCRRPIGRLGHKEVAPLASRVTSGATRTRVHADWAAFQGEFRKWSERTRPERRARRRARRGRAPHRSALCTIHPTRPSLSTANEDGLREPEIRRTRRRPSWSHRGARSRSAAGRTCRPGRRPRAGCTSGRS